MLTFEEKLAIIEEFDQLEKREISLGRYNFHFEESQYDKKIVVYRLHPNGNGYVFGGEMHDYPTDDKGMVNIRDFSEKELRDIIQASINSLALTPVEKDPVMEEWLNADDHALILIREEDGFAVYAGEQLDGFFNSYREAAEYLLQEGFHRL